MVWSSARLIVVFYIKKADVVIHVPSYVSYMPFPDEKRTTWKPCLEEYHYLVLKSSPENQAREIINVFFLLRNRHACLQLMQGIHISTLCS